MGLFLPSAFVVDLFDTTGVGFDKFVPSTIDMKILPEVKSSFETSESIRTANL